MKDREPPRRRAGGRRPSVGTAPVVVVGRRPALEAVRSGRVVELLVAQEARSTPALREVVEAAGAAEVPVRTVAGERIEALAEGTLHQGVAARVKPPKVLSESDLSQRAWGSSSLVVILDGVTDPHNLGAVARTAEAAGADALVIPRRRAAHLEKAALKASAGALLHLRVAEVANLPRALGLLGKAGFWVVGLDETARRSIFDERPPGKLALVLGAEGTGLSRLVRESCDELLAIPLSGKVGSLNVSVAAGVALFSYARRGKEGHRQE